MHRQTIRTSTHNYDVTVGKGLLSEFVNYLPKHYQQVFIITDTIVQPLYAEALRKSLETKETKVAISVVPAGERSKNIDQYYQLLTDAIQHNLDRSSLIVALGGGMVGDLAGFVASTYMRGIDYVQVPTTILAHDSSVGGKVAINHPEGKNLIGHFYPPRAVVYDVETLDTLPDHEKRSGYAEVVKHGLISCDSFFRDVLTVDLTTSLHHELIVSHLQNGIQVKANIVEQDERESNIRKFLNFGHTLGHAIESELGYGQITHGEAVAIGMLFAIRVSEQENQVTLPYDELYQWLETNHYPLTLPDMDVNTLIQRMKKDKKSSNAVVQMVLLEEVGRPVTKNISDDQLSTYLMNFLRELGLT
ncbi:3-dehydroquinate synthase [Gracilibacillus halophilus YIM-C55.5]|uniref:3-dehydroquinate synthase n=1 Tax=Gracilibacillus halophilus YIM-C55.5 TaxID=1308866 RepID=N4WMC8_9BACI|nr:3-dehydroquinate synthase [Gracilibacillus halophilus]ENH97337.1 3-dehydroquinate synthase [Gracilibacillus halophilus YIM-C55.5]